MERLSSASERLRLTNLEYGGSHRRRIEAIRELRTVARRASTRSLYVMFVALTIYQ
jgi:hypothetical protein